MIGLSLKLSIGKEIGVSSELNSSCLKARPKTHKQNACAKPKSSNSKGRDTFAYNSDTPNFQEPISIHVVLDGTCTMVEEE